LEVLSGVVPSVVEDGRETPMVRAKATALSRMAEAAAAVAFRTSVRACCCWCRWAILAAWPAISLATDSSAGGRVPPATVASSPLLVHANTHCPAKDAGPSTETTPPLAETDKTDPSPNIMVPSGRIVWSPSRGGAMPGAAPAPPWHSTHVTPCNSGHSLAVPAAAHSGPRSLHHLCRSWPRTENRSRPAGAAAGSAAEAAAAGSAAEAARAALVGGEAVLEVSARFRPRPTPRGAAAATAAAAGAGAARAALEGGEAVLEVSARF